MLKSIIALPAITVVTIPVASCAAVNVKTVSKIEITKQPEKHDYFVGDKLDLSGVKVSATYSDSTLEDVTNDCTFSKENNSVLSEEDRTIIVTHKPSNMKCELNIRIGQGVHVSSVEIDSIITQQVKPGSEYNYTFIGEPKKLGVTVKPEGATNPKVKWEVTDPKIATVDQEGMVTPISEGLTTIKAISEDNPNKTHEIAFIVVEHEIKAQSIKIQNKPSSYLPTGSAHDISAKFLPEDTSIQYVEWESSNTSVATIDVDQTYEQTTKIHAISPGITTITAKNYDGEVQDSFELTVQDVKIKNISFDQEAYLINTFNKEKTQDIRVTIQPETATNKKLKWETSDSEVATVEATDSGATVTQKKEGVVTIKATAQDGTGVSSSVEVYIGSYNKLESIEFAEETIVLEDQSIDLPKITYNPTEPTIKDVDWKISDTSYAEINGDKIIGKKAGEVTITATPLDPGYTKGPISHKLIVKVDPSKIKEIKLDKFYTLNLKIKQKLKVEPEVLPTTATEGYKIVSEDTTKVKIDDNGFLEPLRTGATQIQVISNSGKASSMWTPVYVSNSILTEEIKIKQNPIYIDRTKTSESIKAEAQIIPLGASETLHWYSNNGGGLVFVEHFIASWLCNGITQKIYNPHTKAYSEYTVKADIDGDGKFNANDYIGDDIKIYLITSPKTFSCGNALACNLKDSNKSTYIIGDKSGGGACFVDKSMHIGLGNTFRSCSNFHILRKSSKAGNYISVESGVDSDYKINPIVESIKFFERDKINQKIVESSK